MPNRNQRAELMTFERPALNLDDIKALRRVSFGLSRFLPTAQRVRLATMGLVMVRDGGGLMLTQAGNERLAKKDAAHRAGGTTSPSLRRPSPRPFPGQGMGVAEHRR